MGTHIKGQETTFYQELQNCKGLDLRDSRGKIHDLSFVLLGVIIGLLRNRDGNLSSLHRSIVNTHESLCTSLNLDNTKPISRAQLPRLLKLASLERFEALMYKWFEVALNPNEKKWFAADGKELRGSIEKGSKRGEARVQLVEQTEKSVQCNAYYHGEKESEKTCLQELILEQGLSNQKITADALHLCPALTEQIQTAGGVFLIGLKNNQKKLLQDMKDHAAGFAPIHTYTSIDKGHGRIEKRCYQLYDISGEYFDPRWDNTNFCSLVVVNRERTDLKGENPQHETSYYISNGKAKKNNEYFDAIRNHWAVETTHYLRDVTLKEDAMRTTKKEITRIFSGLRTLVLEILRRLKPKNLITQIETFQDNFTELIRVLKMLKVL
jgi:predicted transposase YbfD/YdcC